nr:MAG TPA: hypothetical protein [Caudoviricetes sp.]
MRNCKELNKKRVAAGYQTSKTLVLHGRFS